MCFLRIFEQFFVLQMWLFTLVTIATLLCLPCLPWEESDTSIMCRITYSKEDLTSLNCSQPFLPSDVFSKLRTHRISRVPPTRRGTTAGQNHQRRIKVIVSQTQARTDSIQCGVNRSNLINIGTTSCDESKLLDFCVMNTRSVNNKALMVKDYVVSNKSDIAALTETWLNGDQSDVQTIGDLTPKGYKLPHEPRLTGRGGGVGLLHQKSLRITPLKGTSFKSFEYSELVLHVPSKQFRIIVLYRPPPSKKNKLTVTKFLEDFSVFLEHMSTTPGHLLITGDFNFHVEDDSDFDAKRFLELLAGFDLVQHVSGPTHKDGGTLDLVITRSTEKDIISNLYVTLPIISDHSAIHFKLSCAKPAFMKKTVTYRNLKSIDPQAFNQDILSSTLYTSRETSLAGLVEQYNGTISQLLDKYAPVKTRVVTIRPKAVWYTQDISAAKRKRRQLERKAKRTFLSCDVDAHDMQCHVVKDMIYQSKLSYYSNKITEHATDQKALFNVVGTLLHKKEKAPLPTCSSTQELADRFANFFVEKIRKIQSSLNTVEATYTSASHYTGAVLTEFPTVTAEQVRQLIMKSASKSCSLDPGPTWLIKNCLDGLLPIITEIVNLSLSTSTVPEKLKEAIIIPLLKKLLLDPDILNHFRPVSNLCYISKIVEKVVALFVQKHMSENKLHSIFQSAYKCFHSTETALLRIHNDCNRAIDDEQSVVLILLDLSAAFDTVDHQILLDTLSTHVGIQGKALEWFKSYLSDRSQSVCIEGVYSDQHQLTCGVPQGSVLGPLLFTVYTQPLADIVSKYGISHHFYADDTQLYLTFKQKVPGAAEAARHKIQSCIQEIREWMASRKLKLNDSKTEMLLIHSRYRKGQEFPEVQIGDELITCNDSARNIGVVFDCYLSMDKQVSAITQQAFMELRNIAKVRNFFPPGALETLCHAFITSRLDNGNSLLYGLPKKLLNRLQYVQNSMARMITSTRKYDHITPVLKELHWLPITARINFKVLLITYKCLNGLAPEYLSELLKPFDTQGMRSTEQGLLLIPRTHLVTYGDRAFSRAAPYLWNQLPRHIRNSSSVNVFKSRLKTYLFDLAY